MTFSQDFVSWLPELNFDKLKPAPSLAYPYFAKLLKEIDEIRQVV